MDIKYMLREMAWERAKGELNSVRNTFVSEKDKWERYVELLEAFITLVEDEVVG